MRQRVALERAAAFGPGGASPPAQAKRAAARRIILGRGGRFGKLRCEPGSGKRGLGRTGQGSGQKKV